VRGRQQLLDRDEDHHASDDAKHDSVHEVKVVNGDHHAVADKGADGLAKTADCRQEESGEKRKDKMRTGKSLPADIPLHARTSCVVDRHGDADSLGNVVDGDGNREGRADGGVVQSGHERGQTFRKVVDGDGERSHEPDLLQFIVALDFLLGLRLRLSLLVSWVTRAYFDNVLGPMVSLPVVLDPLYWVPQERH